MSNVIILTVSKLISYQQIHHLYSMLVILEIIALTFTPFLLLIVLYTFTRENNPSINIFRLDMKSTIAIIIIIIIFKFILSTIIISCILIVSFIIYV